MNFKEYLDTRSRIQDDFSVGTFENQQFWCGCYNYTDRDEAIERLNQLKKSQPYYDWKIVRITTAIKCTEVPVNTAS